VATQTDVRAEARNGPFVGPARMWLFQAHNVTDNDC
jgi:hypothetical protein